MMQWFDKLALAGIAIAFIGWMMFIVGFHFMLAANRQARAELRASIQSAHSALKTAQEKQ